MKTGTNLLSLLLSLTAWTTLQAQDGSDILYAKMEQVDSTSVGDYVHLDFYRRSFFGRVIDTVMIELDGKHVAFVEHRNDNGYTNWFDEQFLQTVSEINGFTIRIEKCKLDSISADSIFVTNYLMYYNNDTLIENRSRQIASIFPKDIIAEVLISVKNRDEQDQHAVKPRNGRKKSKHRR